LCHAFLEEGHVGSLRLQERHAVHRLEGKHGAEVRAAREVGRDLRVLLRAVDEQQSGLGMAELPGHLIGE
jgi:hypothetical protein